VDVLDHVGPGEVEQVGIPGHLARVVAEALAAVVGRGQPPGLDRGPVGAVEHEDPLLEQPFEQVAHASEGTPTAAV